jgi:hypothetical protein
VSFHVIYAIRIGSTALLMGSVSGTYRARRCKINRDARPAPFMGRRRDRHAPCYCAQPSSSVSHPYLLGYSQCVGVMFLPLREKAPESRVEYSAPVGQLVEVEVRS